MKRRALLACALAPAAALGVGTPAVRTAGDWSPALLREARALLDAAASEGLDPVVYRDAAPDAAFLAFLHDLHVGRVRARDLGFGVTVPAPGESAVEQSLLDALAANRLSLAVERLRPPLAQYAQLREQLARYRRIAAETRWAALPAAPRKVEPGQSWAGTAALAERLSALGDLPPGGAVSEARYDGTLVGAVKRFQSRHGLEPDGVLGRATLAALEIAPAQRVRQIELAMERLRWLPARGGRPVIAINLPMFRLWAWAAEAPEATPSLAMDVIVGRAMRTQTPVFADEMTHLVFRPYWNVPRSILRQELLPALERDAGYLAAHDMEIVAGAGDDARTVGPSPEVLEALRVGTLRVRQKPGPKNSLGLAKFIFPNDDNVYLHGTPARELFARSRRDFSHGCVRVADPAALAEWLLREQPGWDRESIVAAMNGTRTQQVNLRAPVPVLLYYLTALVSPDDGSLHFADDLYGHDAALERRLAERRRR